MVVSESLRLHRFNFGLFETRLSPALICLQSLERNSVSFGKNDVLRSLARRITMQAGSICFWDQRTPHGSRCNVSSNFRAAMFLKVRGNRRDRFPPLPCVLATMIANATSIQAFSLTR